MRWGSASSVVVAGGLLVTVTACSGGDDTGGLPAAGAPATSTTASATPTATASASAGATAPATTSGLSRGRATTHGAVEQAVATTWLSYWHVRVAAYAAARVPADALTAVATGTALSDVTGYVAQLKATHRHSVGEGRLDVSSVTAKGSRATLRSCLRGTSYDVDASGRPVQQPSGQLGFRGTLVKQGASWLVSEVVLDGRACR